MVLRTSWIHRNEYSAWGLERVPEVLGFGDPQVSVGTVPLDPENEGMRPQEVAYGSTRQVEDVLGWVEESPTPEGPSLEPEADPEGLIEHGPGPMSLLGMATNQVGIAAWMGGSSIFCLGLFVLLRGLYRLLAVGDVGVAVASELIGSCGEDFEIEGVCPDGCITFGVAMAWLLAGLGFFFAGHFEGPSRFLVMLPGCGVVVSIPLEGSRGWWLWMFAVLLFGLLHPAEASGPVSHVPRLDFEGSLPTCPVLVPSDMLIEQVGLEPKGGLLLSECIWLFAILSFPVFCWEAFRCVCRKGRTFKTVASQTEHHSVVCLPLEDGVPHRARILFCLWQSGYAIDVEEYPVQVQEEYHGLLGSYLMAENDAEVLSDGSSTG